MLGKERVYATRGGSDNNPESVVKVDTAVYFAHKTLGKYLGFSSSSGVEEYFRRSDVNIL